MKRVIAFLCFAFITLCFVAVIDRPCHDPPVHETAITMQIDEVVVAIEVPEMGTYAINRGGIVLGPGDTFEALYMPRSIEPGNYLYYTIILPKTFNKDRHYTQLGYSAWS